MYLKNEFFENVRDVQHIVLPLTNPSSSPVGVMFSSLNFDSSAVVVLEGFLKVRLNAVIPSAKMK